MITNSWTVAVAKWSRSRVRSVVPLKTRRLEKVDDRWFCGDSKSSLWHGVVVWRRNCQLKGYPHDRGLKFWISSPKTVVFLCISTFIKHLLTNPWPVVNPPLAAVLAETLRGIDLMSPMTTCEKSCRYLCNCAVNSLVFRDGCDHGSKLRGPSPKALV
ncbi:hypothetical protein TNCV_4604351 [Trichonephila clavipes]|nr:hypothetical protein TNCV_4604351 [Trichonephila clavipes]